MKGTVLNAMSEKLNVKKLELAFCLHLLSNKFFQSIDSINITVKCCCYCRVRELGVKKRTTQKRL